MKGKSDISNFALRAFLTRVGHRYDELRELEPFKPTARQWAEVMDFFGGSCAYCGSRLVTQETTKDHLVPLNKSSLGLHAWGNVVACCARCNRAKHSREWLVFLDEVASESEYADREARILQFQRHYQYDPGFALQGIAQNLYQDVGEVAMTLINLRFAQAEQALKELLKPR